MDVSGEKWDRVRVVCTQPFNKHVKYGIAFIQVTAAEDEEGAGKEAEAKKAAAPVGGGAKKLGAFTLRAESSLFEDSGSRQGAWQTSGAGLNLMHR